MNYRFDCGHLVFQNQDMKAGGHLKAAIPNRVFNYSNHADYKILKVT